MSQKAIGWVIVAAIALFVVAWYVAKIPPTTSGTTATSTPTTTQQAQTPAPTTTKTPTATRSSSPTTKSTATTPAPTTQSARVVGVSSLSYLIGLKQDLVCSISTTSTVPRRTGTVYVSGGQMRANLSSTVSGQTFKSHMINDGKYLYVWMDSGTNGTKLLSSSSVAGSVVASRGGIDPTANVNFACNPWTVDSSVFTPPTDITFST